MVHVGCAEEASGAGAVVGAGSDSDSDSSFQLYLGLYPVILISGTDVLFCDKNGLYIILFII